MWNFDLLAVFASGLFGSCNRTAKTGQTKTGRRDSRSGQGPGGVERREQ